MRAITALLAASLLLLTGCAALRAPVKVHVIEDPTKPHVIEVDATRRGIIVIPRADGKGFYVCSEPSPDVALSTINRILAEVRLNNPQIDAKTQIEFSTAVVELTKKSVTLQFLREALFRLCEQGINQQLSPEQIMAQYDTALKTALKLAEAELVKNQADLARALADPKVRDLWTRTFGEPPARK